MRFMKVYCSALISQNKFPLLRPGRPVQVYSVQLLKASLVLALALALDCGHNLTLGEKSGFNSE